MIPCPGAARGDVIIVYVYDHDFSIHAPPGPVEDPVIMVGDTIRWVWLNDGHNVLSVEASTEQFGTNIEDTGYFFEYTFNNPGVFWYYCQPHGNDNGDGTAAGMAGYITVVAPAPGAVCPIVLIAGFGVVRRRR